MILPIKRLLSFLAVAVFLLLLHFSAFAIEVKIENPKLYTNGKSDGQPAVVASCKLTVSGIQGQKFQLSLHIKDENGKWHNNSNGKQVFKLMTLTAKYETTVWSEVCIGIKYSDFDALPGTHTYKAYLDVRYNGKYQKLTYAGSFTYTGNSNASEPIYESDYYYSGVWISDGKRQKVTGSQPSQHVKIYDNRIEFGDEVWYRKGTQTFNGNSYPKYCAVDKNNNILNDKYIVRDGKVLLEVGEWNLPGSVSYKCQEILEGRNAGDHNASTISPQPSSTPATNTPRQTGITQPPHQKHVCHLCNGYGKWKKNYAAQYSGNNVKVWCDQCKAYDYPHYHEKCAACNGTGWE